MKSFLYTICFLLSFSLLNAQNCLEVEYVQSDGIQEINKPTFAYNFISDFKNSSYEQGHMLNKQDTITKRYRKGDYVYVDMYIVPTYKDKQLYYMDYKNDSTYSFENALLDPEFFIIRDELPSIEWDIKEKTDTLMGYTIQQATTRFMGRDYIAWFTPEIPFSGGPRRMHGLPGFILKAKSLDGYVSYDAVKVKISQDKCELRNPLVLYPKASQYTIDDYGKVISADLDNEINYLKSKGQDNVNLNVSGIEIRRKKK